MPSCCSFELNKPQAIYFSGEIISGNIILNTTKSKNVRDLFSKNLNSSPLCNDRELKINLSPIKRTEIVSLPNDVCIIFLGEGKVKWKQSTTTHNTNGRSFRREKYYTSHEVYVNNFTCVYSDGVLPPGQHIYTFSIPLPPECPTSVEGEYGHIRYEIILKINRYYHFDNIYKKPVTVIKTNDLNLNPALKLPVTAESIKSLCCWPCSKGKIFFTLTTPYGAYTPGQSLIYTLDVRNQSMADIDKYFIEFYKKMIFTAKNPRKEERYTKDVLLYETIVENCLRLSNSVVEGEMIIPPTPPSTYKNDIIYVKYKLKVTLHTSGCNSNPSLSVPIVIGTIPIRETLTHNQILTNSSETQDATNAARDNSYRNDLPPSYSEIVTPTFEEVTSSTSSFIDTDIDARNRIVDFKPLYPIYKKI